MCHSEHFIYIIQKQDNLFFWSDWFKKGLIFVTDLLNQSGDLYNHTEFISNRGLNVSSSEYRKQINYISPKLLHLIKTEKMYTSVTGSIPDHTVGGLSIKDKWWSGNRFKKKKCISSDIHSIKTV